MNKSFILLFIFLIGIFTGYSLHETKDKIEIHEEANKIFRDYQDQQIQKYNTTYYNISRIDLNE